MDWKRRQLKIVVLGDSGVGKTSLMSRYIQHKFSTQYKATIGIDFLNKDLVVDGQPVTLQLWDTAGQERFSTIASAFYRGADGCVLVYDVTNPQSLDKLDEWQDRFLQETHPKDPVEFPFVCLGNKIDVELGQRRVSTRKGQLWCENHYHMPFFETSAKDAINVDEAFTEIVRRALKQEIEEPIYYPEGLSLQEVDPGAQSNVGSSSICSCI